MNIKIVYFACLVPDVWYDIITEQLDELKELDLYHIASKIYMSVISENDNELIKLMKLIKEKYNKIELINVYKENVYEYPGLKTIYQIAEDDDDTYLLYFHSKGMTSKQHDVRKFLFKSTIENYEIAINEFQNNKDLDVVCAIPHENGFAFFNFFWVRSSFIRNYCNKPEITDNRYIWEVWIGTEYCRKKKVITYSPIIKYDQVKTHAEVWDVHNRIIQNHYYIADNTEQKIEIKPIDLNKFQNIDFNNIDFNNIDIETIDENIMEPINKPIVEMINEPIEVINEPIEVINEPIEVINEENNKDILNPYTIYEKYKNKNKIALDLGSDVGLATYMLAKKFKQVIANECDLDKVKIFEKNMKKYGLKNIKISKKKITNIKENKNNTTLKEFLYNAVYKFNEAVSFINCDLKGNEENIIEDLFHFAFNNKCNIFIKFDTDKWVNKDINRFKYLFSFFKNTNIKNYEFILFEPKNNSDLQLVKKNISVLVIGYNQYTYISKMVKQLENYTVDIIIADNCSSYQPLLDYYDKDYKYTLLKLPKNYGHKVYEEKFINYLLGDIFIITDPDLRFNDKLPKNFISNLIQISNQYRAARVGFALLIDTPDIRTELSYASMPIKQWEGRFWMNRIPDPNYELYNAPIDTTFCLMNYIYNKYQLSIRIAGNYTCKHLPWHINFHEELLDDEYDQYLINNKSTNFWEDKTKKIVKKEEIKKDIIEKEDIIKEEIIEKEDIIKEEIIEKEEDIIEDKIINLRNIKLIENSKNSIAINMGKNINNITHLLLDNFKFVISVEENKSNINIQSDNILNFINKIVNIKKNKNDITFKEMLFNNKFNSPISFINCDYDDGNEENILEDLLYYAFTNKVYISIKFSIDKWKNKDVSRFKYLFDCFTNTNIIEYLNNTNETTIFFTPNKNLSKDIYKNNMTVVIIGFNQYTYISNMVKQLEKYTTDIVIIDNNSTYLPLLDYYEKDYKYTVLKQSKNHGHKVYEQSFVSKIVGNIYFITDPDLKFNPKLPKDFIKQMIDISIYFEAEKVGFALTYNTSDIRKDCICFGKSIKDWEHQYWQVKLFYPNHEIYDAAIDTTFCLVNKQNKGGHYRVAGNYTCKHLPWHINFEKDLPKEEYDYYLNNNISTNYWKIKD